MSHIEPEATVSTYVTGFVVSVVLTLVAYTLVTEHIVHGVALSISLGLLALVQFVVQMIFFLHLGKESKPRWKLYVFLFMLLVVGILVSGSIWIMTNLNYNHIENLTPAQVNTYMNNQDGL